MAKVPRRSCGLRNIQDQWGFLGLWLSQIVNFICHLSQKAGKSQPTEDTHTGTPCVPRVLMSAGHALLAYKLISPKLLVVELLTEQ
jgi:hypothetical protein